MKNGIRLQKTVIPFEYDRHNTHRDENFNRWARYIKAEIMLETSSVTEKLILKAKELINK